MAIKKEILQLQISMYYTDFVQEFDALKNSNLDVSSTEGNKRKNLPKNRYIRVVHYDFNRIILG